MKAVLAAIAIAVAACGHALAADPSIGRLGLYTDENRSSNEVSSPGGVHEFTIHLFAHPGENGMMAVEFSVLYPGNVAPGAITFHPNVTVTLGSPEAGISIAIFGCQNEWIRVFSQKAYLLDAAPAEIRIAAHPSAGTVQFASCLEGFPLAPAYVVSPICLNSSCAPDTTGPALVSALTTSPADVKLLFSEALFKPAAVETSNYEVFETLDPANASPVAGAELLADGASVILTLGAPLADGTTYTARVSGVQDAAGNEIAPASETQFSGRDDVPPEMAFISVPSDSVIVLRFSESVIAATAEQPGNYCISPNLPNTCPIVPAAAELTDPATVILSLDAGLSGDAYYYLFADGVSDLAGNVIAPGSFARFFVIDFYPPRLVSASAIDRRLVEIFFSEDLDPVTALYANHYRILAQADELATVPVDSVFFFGGSSTVRLALGSDCPVEIPLVARVCCVKDVYGNPVGYPADVVFTVADVYPPAPVFARAPADTIVETIFDERLDPASAEDARNYTIRRTADPSVELPVGVAVLAGDSSVVRLLLDAAMPYDVPHTVLVSGVRDRRGNAISGEAAIGVVYPDTFPPAIADLYPVDERAVVVLFDEPVVRSSAESPSAYAFALAVDSTAAVPIAAAMLSGDLVSVRLDLGGGLVAGENYRLSVTGVADMKGNTIKRPAFRDLTFVDMFPPRIERARTTSPLLVDVFFDERVDPAGAETAANYGIREEADSTRAVAVSGASLAGDSSIVRLSLADSLAWGTRYLLRVSGVADRWGNAIVPGSGTIVYPPDTIPPAIKDARTADYTTVVLHFTKIVVRSHAQDMANYRVYAPAFPADRPEVIRAELLEDGTTVRLTLAASLILWREYAVRASDIEDNSGLTIAPGSEMPFVCSPLPARGGMGIFADVERRTSSVYQNPGLPTEFTLYVFCYPSRNGQKGVRYAILYPPNVERGTFSANDGIVSSSYGDPATGIDACLRECSYDWIWTHTQTFWLLDAGKSAIGVVAHPAADAYGFLNCAPGAAFETVDIYTHLYCNCSYTPGTLLAGFAAAYRAPCVEIAWSLHQMDEGIAFAVSRAAGAASVFQTLPPDALESDGLAFVYRDCAVEPGENYRYRVTFSARQGEHILFETPSIASPAMPLSLFQNRPNPFNPSTTIEYYLPRTSDIVLEIYDVAGRRVACLARARVEKGRHTAVWNGVEDSGKAVSSGVYLCRLRAGKECVARKMVLLR